MHQLSFLPWPTGARLGRKLETKAAAMAGYALALGVPGKRQEKLSQRTSSNPPKRTSAFARWARDAPPLKCDPMSGCGQKWHKRWETGQWERRERKREDAPEGTQSLKLPGNQHTVSPSPPTAYIINSRSIRNKTVCFRYPLSARHPGSSTP